MNCPNCPDTALSMSERQGIEIDFCPKCRGVWLDRGELDKIIEKTIATAEVAPATPPSQTEVLRSAPHNEPQYRDQHHRDPHYRDGYKYKRKKSFLEELFD